MILNEPENLRTIDTKTGNYLSLTQLRRDQKHYQFKFVLNNKIYNISSLLKRLCEKKYEYAVQSVTSDQEYDSSVLKKFAEFIAIYKDSYAGEELEGFEYGVSFDADLNWRVTS